MSDSNITGGERFAERSRAATRTAAKIQTRGQRRFADLALTGEVTLAVIKEPGSSFAAQGDAETFSGSILHVSEESALIETTRVIQEGSLLSLSAALEASDRISDSLAVVNRVDEDDGAWIMGLSFVGRDQLADILSGAELELLDKKFGSFVEQVKRMLMLSQPSRQRNGKEA